MDLIEKAVQRQRELEEHSLIERAAAVRADQEPGSGPGKPEYDMPPASPERVPSQSSAEHRKRVILDFDRFRSNGILIPGGERTRLTEEFRVIKRPLILKAFNGGSEKITNGNLIMVTSARPNEGKTFTAINLAISMAAERDLTVLLVDADLTRPQLLAKLGVRAEKGLVDVLDDRSLDFADVLIRTNVGNLSLLPAGRTTPNSTELLASKRMVEVVAELASRYTNRLILFDAPPVLASSESSVLALHVGQIVFVVEAFRTAEAVVRTALEMVSFCDNVGLVLNNSGHHPNTGEFGSYYQARSI